MLTKTSGSVLGGVHGERNPRGGGGGKRVVMRGVFTRRRRTGDEGDANTINTNKKLRSRAFAREYPTYDELPGRPREGRKPETNINGGWQPTGNEEEDFFFKNTPREPQQHIRGRRNDGNDFYGGGIAISSSSSLSAAARDWFELCFAALKTIVPLTAICACVAAASMNSARYTMLSQVYQLATGMTTAGVILSGFAVFASVMSGFFVAASAFADFGGASTRSANANYARRKKKSTIKKKKNGGNAPPRQNQQNVITNYEQHHDEYIINSNEQQQSYQQQQPVQQYQQPQQQQRRKAVERYEPPMVHPTRPPSSPSKRAAREAYDSWTPEIPIVDPRAHVPRPSDVDYYENSSSAPRLGGGSQQSARQPEWDRNESWGSYKSPGQRRREMGYEFNGTQALKNYVDPRDQYERRVSNRSPEAENVYNQHRRGGNANDELRAPRHDVNNYTNPIPERDRLIPKPMERPKPGYIPTEVLIAMGGASLSNHIKTKFEDGSVREMKKQREAFNNKKKEKETPPSTATNMFGEKVVIPNSDQLRRHAR